MLSTQLAHHSMAAWRCQQLDHPRSSLLCCVTMLHRASLSTVDVVCSTVSLGEIFCNLFTTCHMLLGFFEPCQQIQWRRCVSNSRVLWFPSHNKRKRWMKRETAWEVAG